MTNFKSLCCYRLLMQKHTFSCQLLQKEQKYVVHLQDKREKNFTNCTWNRGDKNIKIKFDQLIESANQYYFFIERIVKYCSNKILKKCIKTSKNHWKSAYCHYIEINLIQDSSYITALQQANTVDELKLNLSALTNVSFIDNETFLFIDEVQECKEIVTKYYSKWCYPGYNYVFKRLLRQKERGKWCYPSEIAYTSESLPSNRWYAGCRKCIYRDIIQENIIRQYKLYFTKYETEDKKSSYLYNNHSLGELDFLIEHDGSVLPIEVKSGKDYYVHSAISKATYNEEY